MRVAVVSRGDLVHVLPYLDYFVRHEWEVHWLQLAPGPCGLESVQLHPCYFNIAYKTPIAKLTFFLAAAKVRAWLKQLRPDVIHAHYASSGGLVAWWSGVRPYCVTIHGSDLLDVSRTSVGRLFLRRIFREAALINPVCRHMNTQLDALGVDRERVLNLTFGIEVSDFEFAPRHLDSTTPLRILCTRSLDWAVYDIPTILKAVAEVCTHGHAVRLTLAAGGHLQPRMEQLADDLGIRNSVQFLGGYEYRDLPRILADHHVYISASRWDGTSLSLIEAMAAGLFPIVSDIPANREWIDHGQTGVLFPVGDACTLADHLLALRSHPERLTEAMERNRIRAEEDGDRRKNLPKLLTEMTKASREGTARQQQ